MVPFPDGNSCDSIVTVTVVSWPTATGTSTLHACPGTSITYAGINIPVGTTQQVTLQTWHGCDSIVTVNVLPWPTSTGSATLLFACNGRGRGLYGAPDGDITPLQESLGGMVPATGMFCAGEIGPVGERNFLLGHTASIAIIRSR